jgi:hypothetical protein
MKPRSIFKSRRHRPDVLILPPQPRAPYHDRVIEVCRDLTPGTLTETRVWHRHDCPRPRGGPCVCKASEIDVELVDPQRN